MSDLRAELLAAFEAELADHLGAIRAGLAEADAGRGLDLRDVSRRAHSLKGAARAVEQPRTESLAHEMEALLLAVEAGERDLDEGAVEELRRLADAIEDSAGGGEAAAPAEAAAAAPAGQVRIQGAHVERLAHTLHDLVSQVQEGASIAEGLEALQSELASLSGLAERVRAHDLARRLARSLGDVERLRREQARQLGNLDRAAAELERDAEHILLLPLSTLLEGYERMVRDLASSQGKSAILVVEEAAGEADRRVLHALREPILHLLRNAVSHGIEPPSVRIRAGKPDQGRVTLAARLERGQLTIVVGDDGAGLDHRRIEARARAEGLIGRDDPRPSPEAIEALLFEQGFSTAASVDEVSGRGIGLSVVAEAVRRLHGNVAFVGDAGGGAAIRLTVPAAVTRQTLLLVEAGGETFGLPAGAVAQVLRLGADQIERSEGGEWLPLEGGAAPVQSLAALLGLAPGASDDPTHPALVLRVGPRRIVLVVDALHEVGSIVVGDPTAIAAPVPLVYGTALVDDAVVLVLSPDALMTRTGRAPGGSALVRPDAAERKARQTILVVDDSITTRTLEKSILEAQGYAVRISVDGLAALEWLRGGIEPVDLVVADVEMPRMDGFALLTAIRNDPALKAIPVVMMTSRNSPDDIERGLELGADAYVTKQAFDQGELISVIRQLI
ncbi:hybrid sensor histidine kinase/response regulator [Sphingosinicella terrae]|uniref:hybrid sensor histidine kinase/response regulator n=1 Tax=Sphingosinicella terrae TaxID=2172047 RepID=UPI000E0D9472|nr:response regulator [Sphingosinicella terrae]